MLKRPVIALLIFLLAVAQAWDSGVFDANALTVALVLGGIVLLAAALLRGARNHGLWLLLLGAALLVVARVISPVRLNELGIILPIAVMPFLWLHVIEQRARTEC